MWPLAVLTDDGIYVVFFNMKMYDRVAGPKKSGRNNEMTRPDYRGGRKVGFHCTMVSYPSYTTIIYYYACIECDNRTFIVSTFS